MKTPEPLKVNAYLVVRADGTMRVVKQPPRLSIDEVAFPVTVTIPKTWGRVQPTRIDVTMPEPPAAFVTVGEPDLAPEPEPVG